LLLLQLLLLLLNLRYLHQKKRCKTGYFRTNSIPLPESISSLLAATGLIHCGVSQSCAGRLCAARQASEHGMHKPAYKKTGINACYSGIDSMNEGRR
jgi:hypothetical protein